MLKTKVSETEWQCSPRLCKQPGVRLAALAFLLYFHFWCSFFFFSQLKGIKLETVWCLSTMHLHVYLYQHLASGASLLFHSLWANALCIAAAWGSRARCYKHVLGVTNTCSVFQQPWVGPGSVSSTRWNGVNRQCLSTVCSAPGTRFFQAARTTLD